MTIAVEISMYPLDKEYIEPITQFILALRKHKDISVQTNTMSTQIFGECDAVFSALNASMKFSMEQENKVVFVCKFINSDLNPEHIGTPTIH
jgi:uncharacterized protein YqgV (UPF0045/DUF77 family)